MKNLLIIIIVFSSALSANAQLANWESNSENKNFAYLNTGYDFGLTNQIGYAYHLNTNKPIFINSDFSAPMGKKRLDDFKYRLGGQMLLLKKNKFLVSAKMNFVLRRNETNLVRKANIGIEPGIAAGIYKPKWHLAAELNYDHSVGTHLKHSERMHRDFVNITDGWYANTGGNFSYGIQASRTLGSSLDLNFRIGKVASKFGDVNPLLPYFTQVGLVWKMKGWTEFLDRNY